MKKYTLCLNGEAYCSFERESDQAAIELSKLTIEEDNLNAEEVMLYLFNSDVVISLDEEVKQEEKTIVDTFTNEQYKIELLSSLDQYNHKAILLGETAYKYHLVFTDINTGIINEELSNTVYLSKDTVLKEVKSFINVSNKETPVKQPNSHKQTNHNTTKHTATQKESIPQINMLASYANIIYKGNQVDIVFTNDNETNTITYKYRKSWSHRKYIDKSLQDSGINPSWEFKYGWEYVS
jgi:hypothetical protein